MAGAYLPPVYQELMLNIDDFLAKIEEAKAAQDDLAAHTAESNSAMRAEGGGPSGGSGQPRTIAAWMEQQKQASEQTTKAVAEHGASIESTARKTKKLSRDTEEATKHLSFMRRLINGDIQGGLRQLANDLRSASQWMQAFGNAAGGFGKALGSLTGIFSGPMGMLSSLVSFAKTWAVMVPTLLAAPALLAAIGGAAGGLAGSFTVLSTAVGLFALGAMKDLSYVTSVSNMAQFDALSAPLQRLYYAYHNLSNEFTIMTQTMGGNSTIIGTLTDMFNTMAVVVQRLGPLMGEVASAGQAAFNILSGSLLGPEFEKFITWVGAEATPVLTTFSQTFVNLASGWAGLMEDLTPAITLFDQGMVHLTQTFTNWANSPKGLAQVHAFISYVQAAWPDVQKFWGGLGHIFYEFFSAGAKGAPGMAAALGGLFTTIGNAMPTLVNFGETVLPNIVKGFGEFASGFMQGIGPSIKSLLNALSGMTGPNWTNVGKTFGQMAGDLLQLLPPLTTVVSDLATMFSWLAKMPAAILAIVGAWITFKSALAFGQLATGLTSLLTLLGKIGPAAAGAGGAAGAAGAGGSGTAAGAGIAADIAGAGTGLGMSFAAAAAGPLALAVAPLLYAALINRAFPSQNDIRTRVGARNLLAPQMISHGGPPGHENPSALTAFQRAADILGAGYREANPNIVTSGIGKGTTIGSKQWVADIKLHTQNIIQVAGPLSPEAQAQIEALFAKHDSQLAGKLMQLRPAH